MLVNTMVSIQYPIYIIGFGDSNTKVQQFTTLEGELSPAKVKQFYAPLISKVNLLDFLTVSNEMYSLIQMLD